MTTRTTLRLILASHGDHLIVHVDRKRLVVESLQTKPAQEWDVRTRELLKRKNREKELPELIGQIHVVATNPLGGSQQVLRTGSKIALFVDDRQGQDPFWVDTVLSIETTVMY